MSHIKLKSTEVKDFLKHIISNNQDLQKEGKKTVAVEVIGEAGLGKTSSIQQLAKELSLDFVKLNLAQIEELGDLVGFPVKQFQMAKVTDGVVPEVNWVDEVAIASYEKEGYRLTGKKRMSYAAPEWIADKAEGGILLLDDWTRADQRFIQACMELIDRQEYISWKLPKNWHIVLSANPANGKYTVTEIDEAVQTRYISVELTFDVQEWAKWAETEGIDGRCINFLLLNPEVINSKVNPRSIVTFFNAISSVKDFENNLPLIQMIGEGCVGTEVSGMFVSFINNRLDKLITPKEMMNAADDTLRVKLRELVGSTNLGTYRADIASVLCTRAINYSIGFADKNKIEKDYLDRIEMLIMEDYFGADLNYHMVKSLFASGQKFKMLTLRQTLTKYIIA